MSFGAVELTSDDDFRSIDEVDHLQELLGRCLSTYKLTMNMINSAMDSHSKSIQNMELMYRSIRTSSDNFFKCMQVTTDAMRSAQQDLESINTFFDPNQNHIVEDDNAEFLKSLERVNGSGRDRSNSNTIVCPSNFEMKKKCHPSIIASGPKIETPSNNISKSKKELKRALVNNLQSRRDIIRSNTGENNDYHHPLKHNYSHQRDDDEFPMTKCNENSKYQSVILNQEENFENRKRKPTSKRVDTVEVVDKRRKNNEEGHNSPIEQAPSHKLSKVPSVFPIWLEIVDNFTKQTDAGKKVVHYNSFCKYCAKFNPDNPWAKVKPRRDFGYSGPRHEATEDHKQAQRLYIKHQSTDD
jgi:ribosomal protein L28